jgi:D-hexose-6-phosphate mutarotase
MLNIHTPWSTAQVYLHGAHVTQFQRHNQAPLLFVSESSRFVAGHPIRGGVPLIFPWFGPREGAGLHGFVRTKTWEINEINLSPSGAVTVKFGFPDCPEAADYPPFSLEYVVTVDEQLTLELIVTNRSTDRNLEFEACLHTYFAVGDIGATAIHGLKGVSFLDKVDNFARKTESEESIRISSEVDRVYLDTTGPVEIHDAQLKRVMRVEKENSASTVVWNPWSAKAQAMPDFGDEEYKKMVCVESGNVAENKVTLAAGKRSALKVRLSAAAL